MNHLLLRSVAGSHLYGYATPESDFDFFEVYLDTFPPTGKRTAPLTTRQSIVDGVDVTQMSFSHFVNVAARGSHQALDAMFSEKVEHDDIEAFRKGFRAGFEVVPTYRNIIIKFALQETPRKQRHALRAAMNLTDILKTGRYSPELSESNLRIVSEVHALPPNEFRVELQRISPIELNMSPR